MRGLNLKEIMSKSNMNQQGLNIATYGQAYSKYPTAKITRTSEITHTTNTNATHPWRTNEACKYMKSRFLQHLLVSFYELHNLSLLKYENHILSSPSKSLGNARLLTKQLLSYLQSLKRSLASLAV